VFALKCQDPGQDRYRDISTSQVTGFYGRIPPRVVSTAVGGRGGGSNSSLNEQDDQSQTRPLPGLSKIVDMLNEQKQLINSVVQTQKELEKTVDLIKSEVAGVKKEMSGLSVSLKDISHKNGATNKTNKLPKPVTVSGSFVRLHV